MLTPLSYHYHSIVTTGVPTQSPVIALEKSCHITSCSYTTVKGLSLHGLKTIVASSITLFQVTVVCRAWCRITLGGLNLSLIYTEMVHLLPHTTVSYLGQNFVICKTAQIQQEFGYGLENTIYLKYDDYLVSCILTGVNHIW